MADAMSPKARYVLLTALVPMIAAIVWIVRTPQDPETQPRPVPFYTVIHMETVSGLGRIADIVIPSLTREDDRLEEISRVIVSAEGLDVAHFYSTVEAFEANHAGSRDEAMRKASQAHS